MTEPNQIWFGYDAGGLTGEEALAVYQTTVGGNERCFVPSPLQVGTDDTGGSTQIFFRGDFQVLGSVVLGNLPEPLGKCAIPQELRHGIVGLIDPRAELNVPTVDDLKVGEFDRPTVVPNDTPVENASDEAVAIEGDILIGEGLIDVVQSSSPVVGRTSTVAGGAAAASRRPKGPAA